VQGGGGGGVGGWVYTVTDLAAPCGLLCLGLDMIAPIRCVCVCMCVCVCARVCVCMWLGLCTMFAC